MKAKIIEESCIACGACEALVPDVFEVDSCAKVKTDVIHDELRDAVIEASESCPTNAIVVEE